MLFALFERTGPMTFPTGDAGCLIEAVVLSHEGARRHLDGVIESGSVAPLQEAVRAEVRSAVCMDGRDAPLLHHAAARGDAWAVRTLLTLGAHPHQVDETGTLALEWAIKSEHRETFGVLLADGLPTRPPVAGPTLVHSAVRAGFGFLAAVADMAMPWPVSIWNGCDEHGMRPVHCAVLRLDAKSAACLVGMGADLRARNASDQTPEDLFLARFPNGHERWQAFLNGQDAAPATGAPIFLKRRFIR